MSSTTPTVATIPPPEKLKEELLALYRVVRCTRTLLKLSERIHAVPVANTKPEVADAAR